jgi:hypothetical protein
LQGKLQPCVTSILEAVSASTKFHGFCLSRRDRGKHDLRASAIDVGLFTEDDSRLSDGGVPITIWLND